MGPGAPGLCGKQETVPLGKDAPTQMPAGPFLNQIRNPPPLCPAGPPSPAITGAPTLAPNHHSLAGQSTQVWTGRAELPASDISLPVPPPFISCTIPGRQRHPGNCPPRPHPDPPLHHTHPPAVGTPRRLRRPRVPYGVHQHAAHLLTPAIYR